MSDQLGDQDRLPDHSSAELATPGVTKRRPWTAPVVISESEQCREIAKSFHSTHDFTNVLSESFGPS